jgi:hypothetical protein
MKKINPVAKELAINPRLRGKPLADKKKYNRKRSAKEYQKIFDEIGNSIFSHINFINKV